MAATVLIVEDQMLIAWHLSDLVEGAGHRVLAIARDPAEAIRVAETARRHVAEHYSREAMRERFEAFYLRLCA